MDENDTIKVAKILLIDRGRVLLLMSKHLKKFHLPGGHIQKNETFSQGMKRELKEETGLNMSWSKIVFSKPNFCLFMGGAYASTVKLSHEHEGYIWARIEDAHKYPLCNFTKRDIRGLQIYWKNKKKRKKSIELDKEKL